ncbi:FUSC family protein [Kytococcus schroeteri]|uniref:FUSC family protein n=1 Tax=Kytococcus schroeteri TaxID=138300 RepID=A0A2I1P8B7_9MICO|nr:FUSC family protein [Kytococcus schroeteri]PKZ40885.1 FUSC family protein [Kytococcus schroeteri]
MPHAVREMLQVAPGERDLVPAVRIALSVAIPLVVLVATGHKDLSIYASFGAFTSLYARHRPTRERLRDQLRAGSMFVVSVGLGALVALSGAGDWAPLVLTALVAGVGSALAAGWNLHPAGALFFMFASGAVASMGPDAVAPPLLAMGVAAASATLSVVLGVLWRYVGEGPRDVRTPPAPADPLTRAQLVAHGGRFLAASTLSGLLGAASGMSHAYWAQIASAAPIAAPTHRARLQRGVQRMIGTIGGVGVTAFVLSMQLQVWHLVVFVVLFQWLAEMFIGRNYSVALLFVTPLALLMIQLSHPTDTSDLLQARAIETVIGALCGMVVVYLWRTAAERRADRAVMAMLRRASRDD